MTMAFKNKTQLGLWLLVSALLLTACGFQLRGYRTLPEVYQIIHVKGEPPYSHIANHLKDRLREGGVNVKKQQSQAPVTIHIMKTRWEKEKSGIQTSSQARIFNVAYKLDYRLEKRNGQPLTNTQTLTVKRQLILKARQLLEGNQQYQRLKNAMRKAMISQLLADLASSDRITTLQSTFRKQ